MSMTAEGLNPQPSPKKRRAKPFAANNASKKMLEEQGWTCSVVEQVVPHCFIKRDCYGFADLLCCSPSRGIMLVQATGGGNASHRIEKFKQEPRLAIWLASGGRVQVHDWRKVAGEKKRQVRIINITVQTA